MKYVIEGYDRRYSNKKSSEVYGEFDNLKDALYYLNKLKIGCLGDIIKFNLVERI